MELLSIILFCLAVLLCIIVGEVIREDGIFAPSVLFGSCFAIFCFCGSIYIYEKHLDYKREEYKRELTKIYNKTHQEEIEFDSVIFYIKKK